MFITLAPSAQARDTFDLAKAVKVGSGSTMVIEFTDPDCPYCQKAEAWFAGKPNVTRYIFFRPLMNHPDAKSKVQYILSAKDRAKAYRLVTSGIWNQGMEYSITSAGIDLTQEHLETARINNVSATPTFIINGSIVVGFDQDKLEQLLK